MEIKKLKFIKLFEELKEEDSSSEELLQEIEETYLEIFEILKTHLKSELRSGKYGDHTRYFKNLLANIMVDLQRPPLDTITTRRKVGLINNIQELIDKLS